MTKMMINNNGSEYNAGYSVKSYKEAPEMFDFLNQEELHDPYVEYDNVPVEIHRISHKCSKCGRGYMMYTGERLFDPHTSENWYSHKCSMCGCQKYYTEKYPKYVAIDK